MHIIFETLALNSNVVTNCKVSYPSNVQKLFNYDVKNENVMTIVDQRDCRKKPF